MLIVGQLAEGLLHYLPPVRVLCICFGGLMVVRLRRILLTHCPTLGDLASSPPVDRAIPGDRLQPRGEASACGVISNPPLPELPENVLHHLFRVPRLPQNPPGQGVHVARIPIVESIQCRDVVGADAHEEIPIRFRRPIHSKRSRHGHVLSDDTQRNPVWTGTHHESRH